MLVNILAILLNLLETSVVAHRPSAEWLQLDAFSPMKDALSPTTQELVGTSTCRQQFT